MADEHIARILKMLEEGKVSASEAETLIAALRTGSSGPKPADASTGGAGGTSDTGQSAGKPESSSKSFEFRWGHRRPFPLDLNALGRHINTVVNRIDPDRILRDARVGGRRWQERMREWARAWQEGEDTPPMNPLGLPTARNAETRNFVLEPPFLVEAINPAGSVTLVGGGDGVVVECQKEAWAAGEEEAARRLDAITLETQIVRPETAERHDAGEADADGDLAGARLILRVAVPDGWRDGLANLSVRLPSACSVRAATLFGPVGVENLDGTAEVQSTSGAVALDGIKSSVRVEVVSGDVTLGSIGGSVSVTTKSGAVSGQRLRRGATVATVSGDVSLRHVEGGSLQARSVSGDVSVEHVGAAAPIDVTLETVSGDARLLHARGNVTVKTLSGDAMARGLDVTTVRGQAVSGDLDIGIETPFVGTIEAGTVSGDIRVSIPGSGNFRYTLATRSGEVHCDHPADDALRSGTVLSGTVGTGAGSVSAQTVSGDISLRMSEIASSDEAAGSAEPA